MNNFALRKPAPMVIGNFLIYARHALTARQVHDDMLVSCAMHAPSGIVQLESGEEIAWVYLQNDDSAPNRS